jgi:hypothetical protein
MLYTDDHSSREQIIQQVNAQNLAYFTDSERLTIDINYAFHACCYFNLPFDFTQKIIELGVSPEGLDWGCVDGAVLQRNNDLLCEILNVYGKSHNIQLMRLKFFDIGKYLVFWASCEPYLPLFKKIIELMPNHSKRVNRQYLYKFYDAHYALHFDAIYNQILSYLVDRHESILPEAWHYFIQKKFPIFDYNAEKIRGTHLEADFRYDRLQDKSPSSFAINHGKGLAEHIVINHSDPYFFDEYDQKILLFCEIMEYLQAPDSLINCMLERMKKHTWDKTRHVQDNVSHQIAHTMQGTQSGLNDEEYAFLLKLEEHYQPWFLNYFKHYFAYDKVKLKEKLEVELESKLNLSLIQVEKPDFDDIVKI